MLIGGERRGHPLRQLETEDMFGIVRRSRHEAMAPLREYLEGIGEVPALEVRRWRRDSSFLAQLAPRRLRRWLIGTIERSGHRLPEPRPPRALQQQHLAIRRVDENKN